MRSRRPNREVQVGRRVAGAIFDRQAVATADRRLDRDSPLPLWAQLLEALQEGLRVGSIGFEGRFPTEEELVEVYGVSRHTVREALRRLSAAGILERRRGRGTFVVQSRLQPMAELYSLASIIAGMGVEERSVVRAQELRPAREASSRLEIGPDEQCVYVERLRFAGELPLSLDRSYLPAAVARPLLGADLTRGSMYEYLSRECGVEVTGGMERIVPVAVRRDDAPALQARTGSPAFLIDRVVRARLGPVEWRRSTIRGDQYELLVEWTVAAGSRVVEVRQAEAEA